MSTKVNVNDAIKKDYYVLSDRNGKIIKIIFPNTVQFGIDNSLSASVLFAADAIPDEDAVRSLGSSSKQWKDLYVSEGTIFLGGARISLSETGKVQIRDEGTESDVIISDIDGGTVDNAAVISAIGFTPARVDLGNITPGVGRSALGIADHTTGSLADLFAAGLTPTRITTGLNFTPANINFSNVVAGTGRSALGISDHVTGSLDTIFNNLSPSKITTRLGYTPANDSLSNVSAGTGRSALGIQDHVTGTLTAVFTNAPSYLRNSNVTLSKSGGELTFSNGSPVSLTFTKSDVDLGNVENKSPAQLASDTNLTNKFLDKTDPQSARGVLGISEHVTGSLSTIFDNLTPSKITTRLGYSPVDPSNPPSNLLNSNVTRGSLGISDHVTGSISDLFDNLTSGRVTTSLGFTPANNSLSNVSAGTGRSALGIQDHVTGSLDTIFNNLSPTKITNRLGYTPADDRLSNVSAGTGRSALGISDHVTGSLDAIFNNLSPTKITTRLGYTPVDPSNPPSNLLNSNVTRSSLGISDFVTGSLTTMFRSAGRTSGQAALDNFSITKAFATQASLFAEDMEIIPGGTGADSAGAENNICILKPHEFVNGFITTTNYYFVTASEGVKINDNNDIAGARYIGAGGVTSPSSPMTIEGDSSTHYNGSNGRQGILYVKNTDTSMETSDAIVNLESSDTSMVSSNYWISFRQGSTLVGSINSAVAYSTFTGQHTSILSGSVPLQGSILTSTGKVLYRKDVSNAWVETTQSTVSMQKNVIGVFDSIYEDETPISHLSGSGYQCMYNALGEGQVLVTDENGNIENGDYVCSSNRPGHGMKQNSDSLKNYTVAKATESIDFATVDIDDTLGFKSKLLACTYHCG